MNKRFLAFSVSTILLGSCGDDVTAAINGLAALVPSIAVTSPSASRTSTMLIGPQSISFQELTENVKPVDEMVADLKEGLKSGTADSFAQKVGSFTITSGNAECFGPNWTDDATGPLVNRPGGDLGMVYDTGSNTDTSACAASQMNALLAGSPQFANKVINFQAALIAGLKTSKSDPPAKGEEFDGKTSMPTISGLTISEATVTRLVDDSAGNAVYLSHIVFTDASNKEGDIKVYHSPTNAENTNFKGLIQAILPHTATMNGTGTHRGMSMVYDSTDGQITFALDIAANRSVDSDDFFSTTTGRVDYSKNSFGEDGHRILATFNSTTGAGTMHYAWQAGSGDGSVRSFVVQVSGEKESLTGVAYFGFGAAMSTLTDDVSTPWPTKMHCNWLNQLSNGPSVAKVQGQKFTLNASKVFALDQSAIAFAPTNDCNGNFTVTNADFLNGARTVTTNSLVSINELGTIATVTAPTFTIPSL